jgi:geranylgeranyl pyrophosphate synthase
MVQLKSIYEPIRKDLEAVEVVLSAVVQEFSGSLAAEVSKALSPRGKRLRPALLILSCRAVGSTADVSPAAAAVELVHSAALLHDDVVDHALTRRGAATASALVGPGLSVVLGNYLYSRAFGLMPNLDGIRHSLSSATAAMCSGEALELARRGNVSMTVGEYMHAAGKKTAILISACCAIGATLAGGIRMSNSLSTYGLLVGLAFQIRDDCIDVTGCTETTGKGGCRDFVERNATLPLILALSQMTGEDRARVASMFEGTSHTDPTWLAQKVSGCGGIDRAMSMAQEYSARAVRSLAEVPDCGAKHCLELLAAYSVERDS